MKLHHATTAPAETDVDLLAVHVPQPAQLSPEVTELDDLVGGMITREIAAGRLREGKGDALIIPGAARGPRRLVLVSTGSEYDGPSEALRTVGGKIAAAAKAAKSRSLAIAAADDVVPLLVEGFELGSYRFSKITGGTDSSEDGEGPTAMELTILNASQSAVEGANRALTISLATNWARDLANMPPNIMTPRKMAEIAHELADTHDHLSAMVLDREAIRREGLGLLGAVGQGSPNEEQLIVLEWNPPGVETADDERIAFIGKAVTFDTGGISIKPSAGMADMRLDKSGGCAVLGAMRAIAEVGVQHRILAIVGAAENMPGGAAYKPGDVITALDGTTVEVTNTDAEGRLVLADAIAFARRLGCARIVELSTLTGHMVVALGHHFAGIIARPGDATDATIAAFNDAGDLGWHLPMHDAYKAALKSEHADMVNSGPRPAGSLYAAMFLEHFAKDTPLVHCDIAGAGMLPKAQGYHLAKGASGWGVRGLVAIAEQG